MSEKRYVLCLELIGEHIFCDADDPDGNFRETRRRWAEMGPYGGQDLQYHANDISVVCAIKTTDPDELLAILKNIAPMQFGSWRALNDRELQIVKHLAEYLKKLAKENRNDFTTTTHQD